MARGGFPLMLGLKTVVPVLLRELDICGKRL